MKQEEINKHIFNTTVIVQSLLFLLCIWGCLAIYSSNTLGNSPLYFLSRQLLWVVSGMFIMILMQRIPFHFFRENALVMAAFAYFSLLAVLVWGTTINGMCGWFTFAWTSASIQPSEFAKPFFVLLLCHIVANGKNNFKTFSHLALVTVLWVMPVLFQPDAGTAFIYFTGFAIICFLAGVRAKYLLAIPAGLVPLAVWTVYKSPYILKRFSGFWDPASDPLGSGWHIRQFQFTIARCGWFGVKMGKATWSNSYLPLAHSDSVFATVAESLGFLGVLPIFFIFGVIIYFLFRITLRFKNQYQKLFIIGMVSLIMVQALVHISVNLALLPPTGLTFPLLSYGGSSLLSTLIAFGMILSALNSHTLEEEKGFFN
jgi:cell division protein FtsW